MVKYDIVIDKVFRGYDIFIVDILINLDIAGSPRWYPAKMIVDFNANTIIIVGPITFFVRI